MNTVDYLIVFGFLAVMFYIGTIFYKWIGSSDDFYLAGRKLTPFILAAVLTATNVNLFSFIGQAGKAYQEGFSIVWFTWTGNMAMVFAGLFVLPIFRRLRIKTIPEFLELRYNKGTRSFVAILWVLRLTFWLGVIIHLGATVAYTLTGIHNFTAWVIILSVIVMVYTMMGGMWSVTFTDVIQFILMLGGSLTLLIFAMSHIGWFPQLQAQLPEGHLTFVKQTGQFNWAFILAIFILGLQWASTDQGLLQRAFGADNTKTVARGLVLAGIITTPFALLWNIPGLVTRVMNPNLAGSVDNAVPWLIATIIPHVVLAIIVVGFLSSQLSATSGNLNGVATIFTSDIYESILKKNAKDKDLIKVARIVTIVAGVLMIFFAHIVSALGSAVDAYYTIIVIMDMPLFIIAVVYGLLWKRANWQGAITGYIVAAVCGAVARFGFGLENNSTAFLTAGVSLLVTPIISFLTHKPDEDKVSSIWKAKKTSQEEIDRNDVFNIIPKTLPGKISLGALAGGFVIFIIGILMGSTGHPLASVVAISGMVIYFIAGLARTSTN